MENENNLSCPVTLEWCDVHGVTQRKVTYRKAAMRLVRNEFRSMFLEVSGEKAAPMKFELKGITVHKRFMSEGKASIKFLERKCTLYISNAPPNQLLAFLRTLFIKMTGEKSTTKEVPLRTQLLSNKPQSIEDISPVTLTDVKNAKKKISKSTDTTPSPLSRKRKIEDDSNSSAAKKSNIVIFNNPLNEGQKRVFDACIAGENVFFTGSAGTGKSYLLRKIIGALPPDVTTATASTGVAACHIGGISLHQFAGIGDGSCTLERAFQMASKPTTASIWKRCKHLIIDEISMIDGNYFEKIEAVARHVRRNDHPFGGIQLILCGDFLQLPPVAKSRDQLRFCFQTKAWTDCVKRTYELEEVHRQKDKGFVNILNKIRIGEVSQDVIETLMKTSKQKIEGDGILATRLCSHTQEANLINESKLENLKGEAKTYMASDSDQYISKQLDQQTPVPGKLVLKLDAQVMLLKNINIAAGLVNGARGVVTSFHNGLPVVRFRNNREYEAKHEKWSIKTGGGAVVTRKQIPLKLAWAFSIHKSQGLTLDCVEMSLAKVFEAGQAYVALSRAQSLHTLRVLDFKASQVWANPDVLEFYRRMAHNYYGDVYVPLGKSKTTAKKKTIGKKLFSSKPIMSIS